MGGGLKTGVKCATVMYVLPGENMCRARFSYAKLPAIFDES